MTLNTKFGGRRGDIKCTQICFTHALLLLLFDQLQNTLCKVPLIVHCTGMYIYIITANSIVSNVHLHGSLLLHFIIRYTLHITTKQWSLLITLHYFPLVKLYSNLHCLIPWTIYKVYTTKYSSVPGTVKYNVESTLYNTR